jgi:Restriction endonuclease BglII
VVCDGRLSEISRMDCANLVPPDLHNFYDFREWRNPCAVLSVAFPNEWADILSVLKEFRILRTDIGEAGTKGGGKSLVAIRMDQMFLSKGWKPMEFDTKIVVNDRPIESPTHEVDCFKGKVALELEWNNKTEFYDRDLNNFRLLFDLRVVDVGIIITRCDELQEIFDELGRGSSYGRTTTILSRLQRKLDGGAGGGCPVLAIGMRKSLYLDDILRPDLAKEFKRIERRVKKIRWKLKEQ